MTNIIDIRDHIYDIKQYDSLEYRQGIQSLIAEIAQNDPKKTKLDLDRVINFEPLMEAFRNNQYITYVHLSITDGMEEHIKNFLTQKSKLTHLELGFDSNDAFVTLVKKLSESEIIIDQIYVDESSFSTAFLEALMPGTTIKSLTIYDCNDEGCENIIPALNKLLSRENNRIQELTFVTHPDWPFPKSLVNIPLQKLEFYIYINGYTSDWNEFIPYVENYFKNQKKSLGNLNIYFESRGTINDAQAMYFISFLKAIRDCKNIARLELEIGIRLDSLLNTKEDYIHCCNAIIDFLHYIPKRSHVKLKSIDFNLNQLLAIMNYVNKNEFSTFSIRMSKDSVNLLNQFAKTIQDIGRRQDNVNLFLSLAKFNKLQLQLQLQDGSGLNLQKKTSEYIKTSKDIKLLYNKLFSMRPPKTSAEDIYTFIHTHCSLELSFILDFVEKIEKLSKLLQNTPYLEGLYITVNDSNDAEEIFIESLQDAINSNVFHPFKRSALLDRRVNSLLDLSNTKGMKAIDQKVPADKLIEIANNIANHASLTTIRLTLDTQEYNNYLLPVLREILSKNYIITSFIITSLDLGESYRDLTEALTTRNTQFLQNAINKLDKPESLAILEKITLLAHHGEYDDNTNNKFLNYYANEALEAVYTICMIDFKKYQCFFNINIEGSRAQIAKFFDIPAALYPVIGSYLGLNELISVKRLIACLYDKRNGKKKTIDRDVKEIEETLDRYAKKIKKVPAQKNDVQVYSVPHVNYNNEDLSKVFQATYASPLKQNSIHLLSPKHQQMLAEVAENFANDNITITSQSCYNNIIELLKQTASPNLSLITAEIDKMVQIEFFASDAEFESMQLNYLAKITNLNIIILSKFYSHNQEYTTYQSFGDSKHQKILVSVDEDQCVSHSNSRQLAELKDILSQINKKYQSPLTDLYEILDNNPDFALRSEQTFAIPQEFEYSSGSNNNFYDILQGLESLILRIAA